MSKDRLDDWSEKDLAPLYWLHCELLSQQRLVDARLAFKAWKALGGLEAGRGGAPPGG